MLSNKESDIFTMAKGDFKEIISVRADGAISVDGVITDDWDVIDNAINAIRLKDENMAISVLRAIHDKTMAR
jgi:hypothetical protein